MRLSFDPHLIRGVLIAERAYDEHCGLTTAQLARCLEPRPVNATDNGYEQLLGIVCRSLDEAREGYAQTLADEWPGLSTTLISRAGSWHLTHDGGQIK